MASVYQKTPDDKCIILQPREAFMREMNIPANWTVLDLAFGVSYTTAADQNAPYSTTAGPGFSSHLDRTFYGVKDGSQTAPGFAGSRFLGTGYGSSNEYLGVSYGFYSHTNDTSYVCPTATDGGSVVRGGRDAPYITLPGHIITSAEDLLYGPTPNGDVNYFTWRMMRIDRTSSKPKMRLFNIRNAPDPSDSALRDVFLNLNFSPAGSFVEIDVSGADAWDIRHMYYRSPFTSMRVRIHNYGYRLVS